MSSYKKTKVSYLTLTPNELNSIVEKHDNAIRIDTVNKCPQSDKMKENDCAYHRLAIFDEKTDSYRPFYIDKASFRTASRPKRGGDDNDKKKNFNKDAEEVDLGPPKYFKIMMNCQSLDSDKLEEKVTKEFDEDPLNKDLSVENRALKLKALIAFEKAQQEFVQTNLNIYDAIMETFSKDNVVWLSENLGYVLKEAPNPHVQTQCKASPDVLAALKKEDPEKHKQVLANGGLVDLPDPVAWLRCNMGWKDDQKHLIGTTFYDATNISSDGKPRRAKAGTKKDPKTLKPLDYTNFAHWLTPGSFCVASKFEYKVCTSSRGASTHANLYDSTVRTVPSKTTERVADEEDRNLLFSLGLGVPTQSVASGSDNDDDEDNEDNDDDAPQDDASQSLADLASMVIDN